MAALRTKLKAHVARGIASRTRLSARRALLEVWRRVRRQPHQLDVYLSIQDPYSFLLLQVLGPLSQRFALQLNFFTVSSQPSDTFPDLSKWQAHALQDATRLAHLYDLVAPDTSEKIAFDPQRVQGFCAECLWVERQPDALQRLMVIFQRYWLTDADSQAQTISASLQAQLQTNQQRQRRLGHYQSAAVYLGKEWYLGLDRLYHLEQRLLALGLGEGEPQFTRTHHWETFTSWQGANPAPLIIYYSARSPYSYLGLEQAARLAREADIDVDIRPVLPMLMRGMQVPSVKKWYLFLDNKREAERLQIPYGFVADPLGVGVERAYALHAYAQREGKALAFWLAFGRAVNSQGIDAATDSGLRLIVERADLDWALAKPLLTDESWRRWAEQHRQQMDALGLWGVPCFVWQDVAVWGQDRLWVIAAALARAQHQTAVQSTGDAQSGP